VAKKRFALLPEEREKDCDHSHMPYRGSVPCTGPRACTMCGMTAEEIEEEKARQVREKWPR
jgi:hypothetical protein